MKFKGTKGNWKLKHSERNSALNIIGTNLGGRYKIARLPYFINSRLSEEWNNKEVAEQKANALLISKAPEMLELLEKFVKSIEHEEIIIEENFDNDGFEGCGYLLYKEFKQLIKEATEIN